MPTPPQKEARVRYEISNARGRWHAMLIGCAVALCIAVLAYVVITERGALIFSPDELLQSTWLAYKQTYVDATYRTIDPSRGNITTSEGQSYTMLRAVWMGDKTTFDGSWNWTRTNLSRPDDHLFSWLWGPLPQGGYGVLTAQNGENTASDADTNIALALVFAYARWQDPQYLAAARAIIKDIWAKEVVEIQGKYYLAADDLEKTSTSPDIIVNPSYLSPAAYHIFAEVDPTDAWEALRTQSYVLLAKSANEPLDAGTSAHLPPDWIAVSRATGDLLPPPSSAGTTAFSYDALRVPFQVELDERWFGSTDAKNLLADFSFLSKTWRANGRLVAAYTHAGVATTSPADAIAMYGGTLGYFMSADPSSAKAIYENELAPLYDPATGTWRHPLSYYDDNWAWFGIALYNGEIVNLTKNLPASAFSQYSSTD